MLNKLRNEVQSKGDLQRFGCFELSANCASRYRNEKLPIHVERHIRVKLTKLNLVIYKKKKTRPMKVILEMPEEGI
jgi:hypothetical protein